MEIESISNICHIAEIAGSVEITIDKEAQGAACRVKLYGDIMERAVG